MGGYLMIGAEAKEKFAFLYPLTQILAQFRLASLLRQS